MGKGKKGLGMTNVMTGQQTTRTSKPKVKRAIDTQKRSKSPVAAQAKPKPTLRQRIKKITGLAGGGKTSKYRMAGGGKTSKYRMAGGGKMPMVMKDGKKIPAFAADGKGKMKKGGKVAPKKMKNGGSVEGKRLTKTVPPKKGPNSQGMRGTGAAIRGTSFKGVF